MTKKKIERTVESQQNRELVCFVVSLHERADAYAVKSSLERLADDISIDVLNLESLHRQYVSGITSQATYESVFGAQLDCVTKIIPNLNSGPYQVQEWVEKQPARVPQGMEQYISSIALEMKRYLTD